MGSTPHFGWAYPVVGGSNDVWGDIANLLFIAVDQSLWALNPPVTGTIDNMVIGGTSAKAGTFSTVNAANVTATGVLTLGATGSAGTIFFKRDTDGVIQSRINEAGGTTGLNFETTSGGAFSFFTSGGAFGSNAERMRIDAAGFVGIGTAPGVILDIKEDKASGSYAQLTNLNAGGYCGFQVRNSSNSGGILHLGTSYPASGLNRADGTYLYGSGVGGLTVYTQQAQPIYFATNNTERMRIDGAGIITLTNTPPYGEALRFQLGQPYGIGFGNFLGQAGPYVYCSAEYPQAAVAIGRQSSSNSGDAGFTADLIVKNGTLCINKAAPNYDERLSVASIVDGGITALFTNQSANTGASLSILAALGGTPNNASARFLACGDAVTSRAILYSNGGLSNYSANNVNLSDANVKDQITPYSKTELAALEQSFTEVAWGKYKYRDQTHTDWNHGPTAQGIEKAFALTAPELVDETDLGSKGDIKHKGVYETDLAHIGHALLARALKEIAELKATVALLLGDKPVAA